MNINIDMSKFAAGPGAAIAYITKIFPGWKNFIASAILAVFGVLQGLDWVTIVQNPKAFGWSAVGTAIFYALLRVVTNTSPFTDTSTAPTPAGETPLVKGGDGLVRPIVAMDVGEPIKK